MLSSQPCVFIFARVLLMLVLMLSFLRLWRLGDCSRSMTLPTALGWGSDPVCLLCCFVAIRFGAEREHKKTNKRKQTKTTRQQHGSSFWFQCQARGLSNTWVRKNAAELPTRFATRHASERLMKLFVGSSTTLLEGLINSGDSTLSMLKWMMPVRLFEMHVFLRPNGLRVYAAEHNRSFEFVAWCVYRFSWQVRERGRKHTFV